MNTIKLLFNKLFIKKLYNKLYIYIYIYIHIHIHTRCNGIDLQTFSSLGGQRGVIWDREHVIRNISSILKLVLVLQLGKKATCKR
jgi:hypothetical protein